MERPVTPPPPVNPPVKVDQRLLQAVAADPAVRSAHVRVLRLLSQVQSLPEDTPAWRVAAREMAEACLLRAARFDAWNASRQPAANQPEGPPSAPGSTTRGPDGSRVGPGVD